MRARGHCLGPPVAAQLPIRPSALPCRAHSPLGAPGSGRETPRVPELPNNFLGTPPGVTARNASSPCPPRWQVWSLGSSPAGRARVHCHPLPTHLSRLCVAVVGTWEEIALGTFMEKNLRGGPTPAPPTTSVPGAGTTRLVPDLSRLAERVGFAVHRGGSLQVGRLHVVEVLQLVSILVVRLLLRPAGVARGRRSAQYQYLLGGSARTPQNGLSLSLCFFLLL